MTISKKKSKPRKKAELPKVLSINPEPLKGDTVRFLFKGRFHFGVLLEFRSKGQKALVEYAGLRRLVPTNELVVRSNRPPNAQSNAGNNNP